MNRDADTRSQITKDIDNGRAYTYLRTLEIFEASKDAMIEEMIRNPRASFYQVILMLAEAIAHEEMAIAYNSVTDVVLDEMFKIFKKDKKNNNNKTAEEFKADLYHDIRGHLKIKEMMKESGFTDSIREAIRSQV